MIKIDEMEIIDSAGTPFEYHGPLSNSSLSGINLNINASIDNGVARVEKLIKREVVTVEDPFSSRTYQARLRLESSSHTQGHPYKHYRLEVKELDEAPSFDAIELAGHSFPVLRSGGSVVDDAVAIHVLLRLTQEEFERFQDMKPTGLIMVRRAGIDADAIPRKLGGGLFWSSHSDDAGTYYKQVVHLFPEDYEFKPWNLADGRVQGATARIVMGLSARYEALLSILVESGHIGADDAETLLSDDWRSLIGEFRRTALASKFREVEDADTELGE